MSWDKESLFVAHLSTIPPYIVPTIAGDMKWGRILEIACSEETAGIVYKNIQSLQLNVPADLLAELEKVHLAVVAKCVLQSLQLKIVLQSFAANNIPYIPLKGTFLSRFIYPEMGLRDMADIDVLIRKETLGEADSVLRSLGYSSRDSISTNCSFSEYRNSASYFKGGDTTPSVLHIHWHILNASVPLFMYSIDIEKIWAEAREIDFGGVNPVTTAPRCKRQNELSGWLPDNSVKALAIPPHFLLLHLAEHTLKHSFSTFIHLTDISQLVRFYNSNCTNGYKDVFPLLDWCLVFRYAEKWGIEIPLWLSLYYSHKIMGLELPEDVLRRCRNRNTGLEGRYLAHFIERNNRWNGMSVLGYLSMCRGMRDKVRFIRSMVFPPPTEMNTFGKKGALVDYLRRVSKTVAKSRFVLFSR